MTHACLSRGVPLHLRFLCVLSLLRLRLSLTLSPRHLDGLLHRHWIELVIIIRTTSVAPRPLPRLHRTHRCPSERNSLRKHIFRELFRLHRQFIAEAWYLQEFRHPDLEIRHQVPTPEEVPFARPPEQ